MAVLIDYIWQSTFCLLSFYGVYWALLRKKKTFAVTRIYILVTPVLSFVCPLVNIPVEFEKPGISLNQIEFFRALSEQGAPENFVATFGLPEVTVHSTKLPLLLEIQDWLILAYIIVAALLSLRALWGFFQIRLLRDKGWPQAKFDIPNNCLVIPTFGMTPVFSFFDKLFWDDTMDLTKEESMLIYGHELVHIRQRHSWDVIYFQILSIVFWFNPVIHLMRHAITDLHEYLADDRMVSSIDDKAQYTRLLVKQTFAGIEVPLGSYFGKSLVRKRIQMINKRKGQGVLGLLAIIPTTLFLMGLVSLREPADGPVLPDRLTSTIEVIKSKLLASKDTMSVGIKMNKIDDPDHFELISQLTGDRISAQIGMFQYEFEGIKNESDYKKVHALINRLRENSLLPIDEDIVRTRTSVDTEAVFPGNPAAWEEMVLDRIAMPEREIKMGLGGVIEIEFVVNADGSVSDPVIKRSVGGGLDRQFLETIQNSLLPKWKPATYKGKPVPSLKTMSIGFYPGAH